MDLVYSTCLEEFKYISFYFTWSNKRINQEQFIKKKLDRVLVNQTWMVIFPTAFAKFLPPSISVPSPTVVRVVPTIKRNGKPSKFYNYWASLDKFNDTIINSWAKPIEGTFQFQLCHKLRNAKVDLKEFSKDYFRKEKQKVEQARVDLERCQIHLESQPSNSTLSYKRRTLQYHENIKTIKQNLRM